MRRAAWSCVLKTGGRLAAAVSLISASRREPQLQRSKWSGKIGPTPYWSQVTRLAVCRSGPACNIACLLGLLQCSFSLALFVRFIPLSTQSIAFHPACSFFVCACFHLFVTCHCFPRVGFLLLQPRFLGLLVVGSLYRRVVSSVRRAFPESGSYPTGEVVRQ